MLKVGIDVLGFYTSNYYLDLRDLAVARGIDSNKYYVGLGQEKMAVIPPDEDVVTMAADAGFRVLKQIDPTEVDLLLFATESAIDQSKAAGIFVHKLLNLPANCRVLELKQACYSATAGLQLALSMLRDPTQLNKTRKILLIAADVARYGLNTVGESSQGGGAVAMILSRDPRILAIDPESGFYTEDVMDFWRPNYREEALVDGKYSCELYLKLLQKTWEQYSSLSNRKIDDHLRFCYHVPVPRLVEKAHQALIKHNTNQRLSAVEITEQLGPSLYYGRNIGNCYTAALYLSLISLLENSNLNLEKQRLGLYSYGSGCIAEFFSGVVQPDYKKYLDIIYHQQLLAKRELLSIAQYERFYSYTYPVDGNDLILDKHQKGRYRLAAIEQHKRIYEEAL